MCVEQLIERELAGKLEVFGKHATMALCPSQIPHDLTRARTRSSAFETGE
jgi:hypothetical protein